MKTYSSVRRRLLGLLSLAPGVLLTSTAMSASDADKGSSEDQASAERAVEKFLATIQEGFRTRNAAMLTSPDIYYTDDSSPDHYVLYDVMPPFVDVGTKNLLKKNQEYVEASEGPTTVSWTDKRIRAGGPYAFFHGIMHAKGQYKDGRKIDFALRHTLVFKRVGDKYLVIHEHASVPNEAIGIETPKAKT